MTNVSIEELAEELPVQFYCPGDIFAEHGNFIRSVIGSQLEEESDREDVFQIFFLSLVKKPLPKNDELNNEENFKRCLYKAIINDIIDFKRKRNTYSNVIKELSVEVRNGARFQEPDEKLEVSEEASRMLVLLEENLTKTQSKAIKLRYGCNLESEEVAKKMEVKQDSVYRYISSGLKRIREYIKKEGNDD